MACVDGIKWLFCASTYTWLRLGIWNAGRGQNRQRRSCVVEDQREASSLRLSDRPDMANYHAFSGGESVSC
jgi:hypothetical protein